MSAQAPEWPSWLPADGSGGVPHFRPGTEDECSYLALGACNKCGWADPDPERIEAATAVLRAAAQAVSGAAPEPRSWRVELPAGLAMLSLNGRYHWAQRDRLNQALKEAAWAMTLKAKVPRLGRASVCGEYQPVPGKQAPDPDNIALSVKSCIDGMIAAGVLPDDSPAYVAGVSCRIGEPYPRGRMVLVITEVPGGGS